MLPSNALCIGDGVYIWFDGYHIWLATFDGLSITNRIALDPYVMVAFRAKSKQIVEEYNSEEDN